MNKTSKTELAIRLLFVGVFAIAMAYLEAAVVVYLRRLFGITDITHALVSFDQQITIIEVGRELATLAMLAAIGMIAGSSFQTKVGYFLLAFGAWDIFYYVWLRVFLGWPTTLLDRDLLFMVPFRWWGPVLAPVLLAALMCITGVGLARLEEKGVVQKFSPLEWASLSFGVLIDLYVFMADSIVALPASAEALALVHPTAFKWALFLVGFGLILIAVQRVVFAKNLHVGK
jgi:hypothetical protein